jgi:hypothetical protein
VVLSCWPCNILSFSQENGGRGEYGWQAFTFSTRRSLITALFFCYVKRVKNTGQDNFCDPTRKLFARQTVCTVTFKTCRLAETWVAICSVCLLTLWSCLEYHIMSSLLKVIAQGKIVFVQPSVGFFNFDKKRTQWYSYLLWAGACNWIWNRTYELY